MSSVLRDLKARKRWQPITSVPPISITHLRELADRYAAFRHSDIRDGYALVERADTLYNDAGYALPDQIVGSLIGEFDGKGTVTWILGRASALTARGRRLIADTEDYLYQLFGDLS